MKIRIGGVPEHFNLPIHLAIEQNHFEKADIEIEWITYKGGTGQMTKALREHEVDVCIILTEGIVADIINGNPSKIISEYVTSPLIWGIHTSVSNKISTEAEIFNKKYAISRLGSGSHLMAIVHALQHSKTLREEQFEIVMNLDNALTSLSSLESDIFYWEKFTTQPYVDKGILKRISEYPTPWSCFVLAATDEILQKAPSTIHDLLKIIHFSCSNFMTNPQSVHTVSTRYQLKEEDAVEWFNHTTWSTGNHIDNQMINQVICHLETANIIKKKSEMPLLTWDVQLNP
jgi:sulfonate transport system substrate-binding protein